MNSMKGKPLSEPNDTIDYTQGGGREKLAKEGSCNS